LGTGQANIGQGAIIKSRKTLALAVCSKGCPDQSQQARGAANRLNAARGKRCGVERGKHGLSFQESFWRKVIVFRDECHLGHQIT
jgi:hypothetical protein